MKDSNPSAFLTAQPKLQSNAFINYKGLTKVDSISFRNLSLNVSSVLESLAADDNLLSVAPVSYMHKADGPMILCDPSSPSSPTIFFGSACLLSKAPGYCSLSVKEGAVQYYDNFKFSMAFAQSSASIRQYDSANLPLTYIFSTEVIYNHASDPTHIARTLLSITGLLITLKRPIPTSFVGNPERALTIIREDFLGEADSNPIVDSSWSLTPEAALDLKSRLASADATVLEIRDGWFYGMSFIGEFTGHGIQYPNISRPGSVIIPERYTGAYMAISKVQIPRNFYNFLQFEYYNIHGSYMNSSYVLDPQWDRNKDQSQLTMLLSLIISSLPNNSIFLNDSRTTFGLFATNSPTANSNANIDDSIDVNYAVEFDKFGISDSMGFNVYQSSKQLLGSYASKLWLMPPFHHSIMPMAYVHMDILAIRIAPSVVQTNLNGFKVLGDANRYSQYAYAYDYPTPPPLV